MTTQFTQAAIQTSLRKGWLWFIIKRIISNKVFLKGIASLFFITIFYSHTIAQRIVKDSLGEAYFFHTKIYPNQAANNWANDSWAPNGITHDDANWYICSVSKGGGRLPCKVDNMNYTIWRIPVSVDLNQDFDNTNSIIKWELNKFNNPPDANFKNYGHAGDLDHFVYKNVDYLAVPLTGGGATPIIAFFRADDLHFINYAKLNNLSNNSIGWCAVNPITNDLYTSLDDATTVYSYQINWDLALNPSSKNHNGLTRKKEYSLIPISGPGLFKNMQGGEFTPSGNLLYISCGLNGNAQTTDGIHVFDATGTADWQEIKRSTNSVFNPSTTGSCFDFPFDDGGFLDQEPEGLTIWDLGNGAEQHVRGTQLHVLVDDHNCFFEEHTKVFLHHYKSFKCPNDITVYATTASGEPSTNPKIAAFLNQKNPSPNCADITYIPHLSIFPPGKTPVTFTITDHATVKVQCTANVNVINKQDECLIATRIYACDKIVADNYAATHSVPAPIFPCNGGSAKDVWFKITPPSPVFSVETYQVAGGLTDLDMQAFSGTCGHLQEIACDDSSGDDKHAKITFQNLPNSNSIYIRITDHDGTHFGKFGIYARKIEIGANIFNATQFVSGDGHHVFDNPTLIGDVNGDGKADLIFLYHSTTLGTIVRTKISNGDGAYMAYEQTLGDGPSVFKNPTLIGDVNGDGKADLIFIYYNTVQGTVVRTKISNGNGTYTPYETVLGDGPQAFAHPALIGDVNGDGKADLVFVYYNTAVGTIVRTKMSNGNGTYTPYETALGDGPHVFARSTIIGDVNGDGKADLIFLYHDQTKGTIVRTKISNGDGTYKPYEQTLGDGPQVFTYPTLVGDVNGDGKADLIFVYYAATNGTTVRTKISNGDGTYSAYEAITGDGSGVFAYPTLTGDVNGDGKTDLIFVGQNWKSCGLNIRVKMSNGDGTWCQGWQGMSDGSAVHNYPTLTGDINGDGRTDLIFAFSHDTSGLIIRTKIAQNYSLCTTGNNITNPQQQDDPVKIYPNPTTGVFSIATKISSEIEVEILDINGRQIRHKERFIGTKHFDLSSLPNGVYFIKMVDVRSGNRKSERILKIK